MAKRLYATILPFIILVSLLSSCTVSSKSAMVSPSIQLTADASSKPTKASPSIEPTAGTSNKPATVPLSIQLTAGQSMMLGSLENDVQMILTSSDPYIANVDQNGEITGGHKDGVAVITVKAEGQTESCTVTNAAGIRDISTANLVAEMKIGTNFAKTLDYVNWFGMAPGKSGVNSSLVKYHVAIPSPKTISDFKEAGYNAIRLNISFTDFMDNSSFDMNKAFLDAIEQTVNMFLDQGMYCIIDSHYDYLGTSWVGDKWDANWMADQYKEYVDARFCAIWKQVAERFKDYDDYLLFEAMNEPADGEAVNQQDGAYNGRYDAYLRDSKKRVAELNNLFVRTIRETGGNNVSRVLCVGPMKELSEFLGDFTPPQDDRLIVQVHLYDYLDPEGTPLSEWSSTKPAETKQIDQAFERIKKFKDKTGLPMILGEFGNPESMPLAARIDQTTYILTKAKKLGLPAFWWESTTNKAAPIYDQWSLYNRDKNQWYHPELVNAIRSIVYGQ